jgi:hypothetical protein
MEAVTAYFKILSPNSPRGKKKKEERKKERNKKKKKKRKKKRGEKKKPRTIPMIADLWDKT